ncbi:hypothetical protein [Actinoplanes derwentensis]|uniref:Uncharacterized protein n=1 Tax=Actinoplanes derwentensis TaxID=113562 RepID=A0A1H2C423_9ACTN|nr:hypothetical protein [Actinoplanes derwentensis]GID84173.1 hypothetical protein Ade03nite_30970 [Actinoplanes derwentensis]SDT65288.1 hypothetical protein SAMN04489716_5228 [Actinoplanes derwentensis]
MADSENTIPSLVASAWRTAPPVLRRFAYWVWSIGFVAVTLSVIADARNWWNGLQFTTNIIAELVCGMVALPVALVIIARLAEYQVKELEQARLKTRYAAALQQMTGSAQITNDYLQELVQEVASSTNTFVAAAWVVDGSLTDPEGALESAHLLQAQMESQQWLFYERVMIPLRIEGNQLRVLLSERVNNGEQTSERLRFERLWHNLESALRHQKVTMAAGYQEFARGVPTAHRAVRLRDAALNHLRSVDQLQRYCAELAAFATPALEG